MDYRILVEDRKSIATEMEAVTGEKPFYTRMPRCAYILRGIAVEKNGFVTTEDDADTELIAHLIEAGMIAESQDAVSEGAAAAEDEAGGGNDGSEAADGEDGEEAGLDDGDIASLAERYEDIVPGPPVPVKPDISFPLERHNENSICNLIFTIYARGSLISKATKGCFMAEESLVEELKSGKILKKEDALQTIKDAGEDALAGIRFEDDKVVFDGFPETTDPDEIRAWTALASSINASCIKQKHVRPKKVDETNEKFSFRTWLTRIGMNGSDTKAQRSILYRNLSGHTAFRTPEDEEKWKARQAEKKQQNRRADNADSGAEE